MPRIATRHAHKLAYRRRLSLGLRMVGCLVMLAGAIVLAAALAEFAKGSLSREAWLMISFGVVLFLSGAALFCGERGKLIDRETRTLSCWWGVGLPLRRTCDDISQFQAVGWYASAEEPLDRWRVCLWNSQGERLDLFDLRAEDVAEFAARQVAGFLSLPLAALPASGVAAVTGETPLAARVAAPAAQTHSADIHWAYRGRFGLLARGVGVVCLVLGLVLTAGLLTAANIGHARWLFIIAAVAPLGLIGLWLFVGGRRIVVDAGVQTIRVWRAWPLPPATYELAAFHAVMLATESGDVADRRHLIGLIGAEQLRLEIMRGLPREEALAAAADLAAVTRLPLLDESQLAASAPPAGVAH